MCVEHIQLSHNLGSDEPQNLLVITYSHSHHVPLKLMKVRRESVMEKKKTETLKYLHQISGKDRLHQTDIRQAIRLP